MQSPYWKQKQTKKNKYALTETSRNSLCLAKLKISIRVHAKSHRKWIKLKIAADNINSRFVHCHLHSIACASVRMQWVIVGEREGDSEKCGKYTQAVVDYFPFLRRVHSIYTINAHDILKCNSWMIIYRWSNSTEQSLTFIVSKFWFDSEIYIIWICIFI